MNVIHLSDLETNVEIRFFNTSYKFLHHSNNKLIYRIYLALEKYIFTTMNRTSQCINKICYRIQLEEPVKELIAEIGHWNTNHLCTCKLAKSGLKLPEISSNRRLIWTIRTFLTQFTQIYSMLYNWMENKTSNVKFNWIVGNVDDHNYKMFRLTTRRI